LGNAATRRHFVDLLRRHIASAHRLLQESNSCERSLSENDTLIFQGGFQTPTVRYVRRDDAHKIGKSWSVRFSTTKPRPEELYDWLATLK
jgi:hypothetical protein